MSGERGLGVVAGQGEQLVGDGGIALGSQLRELRAQRDAAIAHELLSLAGESAQPALA